MIPAGIRLHDTGIDGKALAPYQASVHAGSNHRLKHMPEDIAVPEAAMAVDRECRMVGHPVVEVEPAEPPISKVQFNFLTQPPLKADAVAVAQDQHPDQIGR